MRRRVQTNTVVPIRDPVAPADGFGIAVAQSWPRHADSSGGVAAEFFAHPAAAAVGVLAAGGRISARQGWLPAIRPGAGRATGTFPPARGAGVRQARRAAA